MTSQKRQWQRQDIQALFEEPLLDLLLEAQTVHRQHFPPNTIQVSTTLSIKTGTCPEDCGFCAQSGHFKTAVEKHRLLPVAEVIEKAKRAKALGATRFCMATAWRGPSKKDLPHVLEAIVEIKKLGMEACASLGFLTAEDSMALKEAGLDYYNHNLQSSPEFYEGLVNTHTYQDRLNTLHHAATAGLHLCCGGIIGMGETRNDRIGLLLSLNALDVTPPSIPLNVFYNIDGTPLEKTNNFDSFEFIRMVAVTRILFPTTKVRLTAGRTLITDEAHALCFMAGANSIHLGEKLLTIENTTPDHDSQLFKKLGLQAETLAEATETCS